MNKNRTKIVVDTRKKIIEALIHLNQVETTSVLSTEDNPIKYRTHKGYWYDVFTIAHVGYIPINYAKTFCEAMCREGTLRHDYFKVPESVSEGGVMKAYNLSNEYLSKSNKE